jgi:protein ImuB
METARGLVVTAVNRIAAAHGLQRDMTLADARARVLGLIVHPAEPERDAHALRRLALWCGRYGPNVAPDGVDGILIDISGAAHLAGGEAALSAELGTRLHRFGLTARLGIGHSPGAAAALARYAPRSPAIVPLGAPRDIALATALAALADLPVEALRIEPAASQLLRRLGLKTIGQLHAVPRSSIERRFPALRRAAPAVLDRLDRVVGGKADPFRPLLPAPVHAVRMDFAEPLIAEAGLQAALVALTGALSAQLAAVRIGARRLALTLYCSDGSTIVIRAGLSRPSRSSEHMLMLLREKLADSDAGFGVDLMVLAARAVEPLTANQADLAVLTAGAARPAPAVAIGELVDRLMSRLGTAAVFQLQPAASHLPERAQQRQSVLTPSAPPVDSDPGRRLPPRPIFLFDPPQPIAVMAGLPDGPPARFRWRRCLHEVALATGPERIAPEWWREIGLTRPSRPRDYYAVEAYGGDRYWVFREGLYSGIGLQEEDSETEDERRLPAWYLPAWYLHGIFA